jgi:hypothetical protein
MFLKWFPVTPGGTLVTWLPADTAEEAWAKLLEDAKHMPYKGKQGFKDRGYSVVQRDAFLATTAPIHHKFGGLK